MDDCGIIVNQLKILLRVRILFLQESGKRVELKLDMYVVNAGGDDVGHALQQPKVETLQELKVEALQELKVDVLQEQKAKSDRSEGVMSKDDNFKEETSTSDSGRQEFQFCDLRVPADEDAGASHTYYEFLKPADA
ncbi:hypothetical protein Tco_0949992 [Tanacetum coccineum]